MNIFINIIIPIIVTFIFSFLLSFYFFKRAIVRKALTPFKTKYLKIFTNIEDELRKDLKIKYKEKVIDNFHNLQITIANTGSSTLKDFKKPLTLYLPEEAVVLNTKIVCIHPIGRVVDFKIINKNNIEFDFYILNKNEFFIFEISIGGEIKLDDIFFKIETEGLPPILRLVEPNIYIKSSFFLDNLGPILLMIMGLLLAIYFRLSILGYFKIDIHKDIQSLYYLLFKISIVTTVVSSFLIIVDLIIYRKKRNLDYRFNLKMPKDIIDKYFNNKK